jgi:hypothetical protein
MEGAHEQNEYRKNCTTNLTLSPKRTKIRQPMKIWEENETTIGYLA